MDETALVKSGDVFVQVKSLLKSSWRKQFCTFYRKTADSHACIELYDDKQAYKSYKQKNKKCDKKIELQHVKSIKGWQEKTGKGIECHIEIKTRFQKHMLMLSHEKDYSDWLTKLEATVDIADRGSGENSASNSGDMVELDDDNDEDVDDDDEVTKLNQMYASTDTAMMIEVEVESSDLAKLCGIEGKMTLLVGNNDIAFEDPKTKRVKYSFQLAWMRRFGKYETQSFNFEVGRKCPNGEGYVTCKTPSAKAIHKLVIDKLLSRSKLVIPHPHVEGETASQVSKPAKKSVSSIDEEPPPIKERQIGTISQPEVPNNLLRIHHGKANNPINDDQSIKRLKTPLHTARCGGLTDSAVPDELAGDPRTLELYEAAIKEGKERDRNIRVMVVGCCGQGKTSLVRHLTGQSLEGVESTNGIEVQICEGILDTQELWTFKPQGDVRVESVKRLATVARLIANKPPESTEHISSHFSSGNSKTHVAQKAKTGNEKHKLLENTDPISSSMSSGNSDTLVAQKEITGNDNLVRQSREKGLKSEMNVDVHTVSSGVLTTDSLEFVKEIKETNEEENKRQEKTLNINIWDFVGQFVYYATHQLFHSRQAIYILVFNIAKGLDVNVYDKDCPNEEKEKSMEEYLKFWIRSVHCFVGNKAGTEPPIFLVGTHLDMLAEHIVEDGRFEDVRKLFDGTVCAFHIQPEQFAVSNTNPNSATFADIRRAVTAYALKKSAGLFIPAKWIPLERSLKENRHLKIITFEEVKEFDRFNDIPIASEDQLKIFLQYHHEKGTFFYFENEYNAVNHVVLDPQFLIDAFRCIITADKFCCVHQNLRKFWQKLRNEAVLEEELLNELWKKESNKEFMKFKKPLLFFLQRHRIIAEALAFDEASSTPVPLNFYIVPSLLKKTDEGMIDDFLKGKRYTKVSIGYNFDYDSTLCTVYNRVTAAVFGRWPVLKFKNTALVYENAVVCKINLTHSGILKRFNNSLELLVVNLCPEEDVSMKDCDAFRRFVEMVIQEELHKFLTNDFEKQYCGYREIVRCYDKDHGYSGSCNVYEFETLRTYNKDIIGCPDHLSHSIRMDDIAEWFNVDIADADVPKRTLTEKELSKLSTSIGKNWEHLARMLGFSDAEIEQVSIDKVSTQARIYEILKRWNAEKLDGATLEVLIHAIRECGQNLTVSSDTLKNLIDGTLLSRQY